MKKSLGLNAFLNTIRQSLSIVFPLITFPYVSRVLGSIEFGKYSFSSSIISYFSLLAAYGISVYGIREGSRIRDDKEKISELAADLFSFNLLTSAVSIILLCVLTILNGKIRSYVILLAIQSLGIIFTSVGMDWINNVYEDFLYITIRYIIIQIIALGCVFIFINGPEDTVKYCLILVCGSYGGNLLNLLYIRKYITFPKLHFPNINKYIIPLTVLFINSLATTIYVNSDIVMLGFYLDDSSVGVYGFSSKIYNTLKYFINSAIVVTIPRIGYVLKNNTSTFKIFIKNIRGILSLIIFPIATGLFLLSNSVIEIIGGEEYIKGISSLQILALALIFALFGSLNTNCILLVNRQEKKVLMATTVSAALNVGLNLILIPQMGIAGAAITTVIAEMVNCLIQSYFSNKLVGTALFGAKKEYLQIILGCVIVYVAVSISKVIWNNYTVLNHVMRILFSMGLSFLLYYAFLSLIKNEYIGKLNNYISSKLRRS